jgi:hypothetical protein
MFFARGETPEISRIEERIAQWVMIPPGQGEGFQILRYQVLLCSSFGSFRILNYHAAQMPIQVMLETCK